ncbi:MAG TPA: FHA domain-containing protein [Thermoanaerobaculia bacterium]|nr:FHA domain-containing protein [Thermoanaerobaculia bacterium]
MRVRFNDFIFDAERRELSRGGTLVHLTPKSFDLLAVLIANHPRAVRKEELYEQLWPDTFVEYANLNNLVSEIRSALGDSGRTMVQTKTRFGFAFAAETVLEGSESPAVRDRLFRVSAGGKSYDLQPGRNLIGRELDCTIVIDSPAVSRYHAVIEVSGPTAVIEDLGSKNGTFVRQHRITASVELRDRDEIEIGRTLLRFRIFDRRAATVSDPRR